MNTYKLNTTIKRDLIKRYKDRKEKVDIKTQKFSYSFLNNLCKKYEIWEFCIFHYCCYGEDRNCWIDEDSCWIRSAHPNKDFKYINRIIYNSIKHLDKYNKVNLCKRTVFVCETDKYIEFCLPFRDIDKSDYYIIFKK